MTDPQRQRDAIRLFSDALQWPANERDARLDAATGDDPALRQLVRRMLAADASAALGDGAVRGFLKRQVDPPQPDTGIERSFRILRVVGEGSSGVVYEAEQDVPRRRVAIKAMHTGLRSQHLRKRFEREARILARLDHPNIARLFDVDLRDEDGLARPYLVMEFVDATPLDTYVNTEALDDRQRLQLFVRVCEPIAYAHRVGVVHRDLKPANILINSEGEPKVVDFGVAVVTQNATPSLNQQSSQILGTISYASPEQLDGDAPVDGRSDVYSMGVILYELLTGDHPVDVRGLSVMAALRRRATEPPVPFITRRPDLPALEPVLTRALSPNPKHRFATVDELQRATHEFLARG